MHGEEEKLNVDTNFLHFMKALLMNYSRMKDPILHVLSNPRVLGSAVFVGVGTAKTFKDYHRVPEDKKRKVLVKDSAVLLSSLAAFAVVSPFTKKFCNTKIINSI